MQGWCFKCPTCNCHKIYRRNRAPLQPIYTGEPFKRVAINIVGPLPRTERGNRFILTVVDHFTKQSEAYFLTDQKAPIVARAFLNEFVLRYKVLYMMHTDQETKFESNLYKQICKLLGIAKPRTSPYHRQCDGKVKRINYTLVKRLSLNVPNQTSN